MVIGWNMKRIEPGFSITMKRIVITFLVFAMPIVMNAQRTRALEQLAGIMAGSYTNADQAAQDTSYLNIELEMVRIWAKRRDGAWFYVEQAAAMSKEKPYRQRVYHIQEVNDSTFTSDILTIKGGERLFGAYSDLMKLARLSPDSLDRLDGCAITLHRRGSSYAGGTKGRDCTNSWGKADFATSEVSIRSDGMVSWDRGFNTAGEQVWGAENGGYIFIKRRP